MGFYETHIPAPILPPAEPMDVDEEYIMPWKGYNDVEMKDLTQSSKRSK